MSKSSAVESRRQKTQALEDAPRLSDEVTKSVSSEIAESADKRLESLSLGKTGDYLQAAEKIISASLPNQPPGTRLRINLDDGSGRFVYQGVDVDTGDVVTQFPSEEILKFVAFNREREGLEGIVVDEEA
ncbi:MAG: flagellar protein FlaG [Emcibacter sp.]|nr:flagellar protein FlaG [Emcibacter sp.]